MDVHCSRMEFGKILVADMEELEILDASESHARILNAKEKLTPKNGEIFHIPNRRWNSKNCLEEIKETKNHLLRGTNL